MYVENGQSDLSTYVRQDQAPRRLRYPPSRIAFARSGAKSRADVEHICTYPPWLRAPHNFGDDFRCIMDINPSIFIEAR